jgi:hypothetical protein
MKILLRLAAFAAVAALGWWLWLFFFPPPENVVRQRLAELARTATFGQSASPATRLAKAHKTVGLFSRDAEIVLEAAGDASHRYSGREEIIEAARIGFAALPALTVEFLDVTVRVAADRQSAELSCTARVRAGDSRDFGVQEMRFLWKKIDGAWLISRAETVKTLS